MPDIAGLSIFTYGSHYCSVDNRDNATALACGYFNSGIRVFDIRDPERPKGDRVLQPGVAARAVAGLEPRRVQPVARRRSRLVRVAARLRLREEAADHDVPGQRTGDPAVRTQHLAVQGKHRVDEPELNPAPAVSPGGGGGGARLPSSRCCCWRPRSPGGVTRTCRGSTRPRCWRRSRAEQGTWDNPWDLQERKIADLQQDLARERDPVRRLVLQREIAAAVPQRRHRRAGDRAAGEAAGRLPRHPVARRTNETLQRRHRASPTSASASKATARPASTPRPASCRSTPARCTGSASAPPRRRGATRCCWRDLETLARQRAPLPLDAQPRPHAAGQLAAGRAQTWRIGPEVFASDYDIGALPRGGGLARRRRIRPRRRRDPRGLRQRRSPRPLTFAHGHRGRRSSTSATRATVPSRG